MWFWTCKNLTFMLKSGHMPLRINKKWLKTPGSCLHRCSKYSQLIWWWCSSTQAALCTMQLHTVDDVRLHFLTRKWQHNIWDPVSTVCRVPISTSRCKFMFNNTIRFSHHRLYQTKCFNQYQKLLYLSLSLHQTTTPTTCSSLVILILNKPFVSVKIGMVLFSTRQQWPFLILGFSPATNQPYSRLRDVSHNRRDVLIGSFFFWQMAGLSGLIL